MFIEPVNVNVLVVGLKVNLLDPLRKLPLLNCILLFGPEGLAPAGPCGPGELIGENSFAWTARAQTKLGKKLESESGLKGGFLDDKLIQSSATAQLRPGTTFNDNYTVMNDKQVVDALMEVINDLKTQILSLNPKDNLKSATVKRYQVGGPNQNELNESIKNKLVSRIVQKVVK